MPVLVQRLFASLTAVSKVGRLRLSNLSGRLISSAKRWIVSNKFHHIRTGEGNTWPIVRINHPNFIDGTFSGELRNFDVTSSPWSRHQLIVPDPFVVTHVHYTRESLFLKVDVLHRTMHSMYTGAHCITFLC